MTFDRQTVHARLFEIVRRQSFIQGDVVLSSGERSTYYFDMKPTMFHPEGAELLAQLIFDAVSALNVDAVGGLEMGAVPLISPVCAKSFVAGKPIAGFFVRKQAKEHGTKKRIEGVVSLAGKRVAIVEDVTTTGASAMKAVNEIRDAGADVVLVLSILDREQAARELYASAGIPFLSLFSASQFLTG